MLGHIITGYVTPCNMSLYHRPCNTQQHAMSSLLHADTHFCILCWLSVAVMLRLTTRLLVKRWHWYVRRVLTITHKLSGRGCLAHVPVTTDHALHSRTGIVRALGIACSMWYLCML